MRTLRILLATLLVALGGVVFAPAAGACACGAAPMPPSSTARVTGESGLVVWDGTTERIDLLMTLSGSTPDAGWIMPAPAGTQLSLGDKDAIDRLFYATQPQPRYVDDWTPQFGFGASAPGSSGATGSGARVESVTDVGPFRVTTLSAEQASGVNDWLRDNGYDTRDELLPTFQTYLDQGWRIQAVKLVPGQGQAYASALPALRMAFATAEPVYPIRLSRHATVEQQVQLYVAAPHRMDIRTQAAPTRPLGLRYAGTLQPAVTGLDRPMFVTAYQGTLSPAAISADLTFVQAAKDDPYVETYVVYNHDKGQLLGFAIVLAVAGLFVALVVGSTLGVAGLAVKAFRGAGRRG